jgi:uncharacterized protein (TIGR03067 family)
MEAHMRVASVALLLIVAAVVGCGSAPPAPPSAALAMEGAWTAVSARSNGAPDPAVRGHRLTFAGNTFVITRDSQILYAGTVTTDPSRAPAHIDFHHTDGQAKGTTWRGVYALGKSTLTIADNAPDPARPRPTMLAAPAGSGHTVVVFTRTPR